MPRILIAEDDPGVASFIQKGLRANRYHTAVVADADAAVGRLRSGRFDLLILDVALATRQTVRVLDVARASGQAIPVVVLTRADTVGGPTEGLAGPVDLITKPFRFEELLSRVRLRLGDPVEERTVLREGDVVLDLRTRRAAVGRRSVELTTRESTLLETFLRHPGEVLSREQLLTQVWGYEFDPQSNLVDVYVGYLRRKLDERIIETVRGSGYRLPAGCG